PFGFIRVETADIRLIGTIRPSLIHPLGFTSFGGASIRRIISGLSFFAIPSF
ncbi:hypothetical protein SERLA73DRAFT_133879, partial [Serpula lacrymans var. lacrymans S7.3]